MSFILHESAHEITLNRVLSFKKSLCKHLKLIRAELAFVTTVKIPRKQLVFQLPSEVLPLLRHCTGWRKEWLFSLNVSGVQISGKDEISVQELKISQLRLQEDPGMIYKYMHAVTCNKLYRKLCKYAEVCRRYN